MIVPVLADAAHGDIYGTTVQTSNQAINFGNYNFAPGTIMTSYSNEGTGYLLSDQSVTRTPKPGVDFDPGAGVSFLNKKTGNDGVSDFGIGSSVHVEIIHSPSNTILYSKDVIVA